MRVLQTALLPRIPHPRFRVSRVPDLGTRCREWPPPAHAHHTAPFGICAPWIRGGYPDFLLSGMRLSSSLLLLYSRYRSLSLKLSDTRVHESQIRARLGTTAHFCKVVVLKLRAAPSCADLVQLSIGTGEDARTSCFRVWDFRVVFSSECESLILSLHSRFTCECNKEEINDDDDFSFQGLGVRG